MCGRFARTSSREVLAAEFGVAWFVNVDLAPRYNIAPRLYVETIVNDGTEQSLRRSTHAPRRLRRWGPSAPTSVPARGNHPLSVA